MASPLQKISVKNLSRFMVALACGAGFSFGAAALYSSSLMEAAGDSWQEYQHANAEQARAIGDVVDALGYGGMIHQFKNFVLRKDDARVRVVQLRAGASMESLARLESLVDSPAQMAAIGAIRGTINEYLDQLELARALAKDGKSSAEIDAAIKVADGPALEGVNVLVAANVEEHDTKSSHLGALRQALGYGGMIHHFKNFVLRQDEPRVAKVRAAIGQARAAIAEYDLHAVSPVERAALDAISGVISRYENGLQTAMARVAEGATPEEIDAAVKVSDAPALEALTQLDAEAARATEAAADVLTYDLDTTITITYVIAALAFVIGGSAAIGSFFILSIGVARPSQRIADAIRTLAEGDLDIDVRDLESGTEIGQIARASQTFRKNLLENQRLEDEREAAAAVSASRQRQREQLQVAVERVVNVALEGDFSARITETFEDQNMAGLADQMNRLLSNFEDGLAQVDRVIGDLASGGLNGRMSGFERGAFFELQSAVNATMERLEDMVGRIHETTEATTKASDAIAAGAHQLSDRANNEAASIEQTASTMSMMTPSIRETADTASQGEGVASEAGSRAKSGGEIVSAAVDAMARIEESSKNIVEIINVIDAIAFQTNLLALNAAVEAARAGESGKGFAVVASEVRSLAQRAAEAAKDISNLINESSAHVAEGGELVRSAGGALEEIREAVDGVVAQMTDITTRAREQATGAQEISEILASMDSTTQHNSELAVRSAANAEALARETHTLRELVAFFQVSAQAGAAPRLADAA